MDWALKKLQKLICHKTQTNQTIQLTKQIKQFVWKAKILTCKLFVYQSCMYQTNKI